MSRSMAVLLGVLLIGAGVACLLVRVQLADVLPGVMPLVVSSLGVVGILAGSGVIGRAFRKGPPS